MTKATIAGGILATMLVLLALVLVAGHRAGERDTAPPAAIQPAILPSIAGPEQTDEGFIHGRIVAVGGATYEGRLRWGGGEEAAWGDFFNGVKDENPWVAHVPLEQIPRERRPLEVFGFEIAGRERPVDFGRPFMARFGDIARIEPRGGDMRVILKSGTVFDLDRFSASDFDDGVRVWDGTHGVVDLQPLRIRSIEFLPGAAHGAAPARLHGTVRTRQGDFSGFVQWNREEGVGSDELDGHAADNRLSLRFDAIGSIARRSRDSSLVTLLDGRQIMLSGGRDVGEGNRGLYVDDLRYGRVLISWEAFERVDFGPGGSGPAFGDFPPGGPLTGSVLTRSGGRLSGRLVFDLDESEITETLDAPWQGVDYIIPFGLIASVMPAGRDGRDDQRARLILHDGEELLLEPAGDLGEGNAGVLIFVDDRRDPAYVPWTDVVQVDFDRPPAMYPPFAVQR